MFIFFFKLEGLLSQGSICSNWLNSIDLGLEGDLASEWDRYRLSLIGAGIALSDRQDELRWMGGDCTGHLTTKNVYNALAAELWKNKIGG
jgi:hypothetical protein